MTVVPPSVSTSVSDLTTALDSARCWAPDDSIVCTNVGSPIGMDAIAVETHSSTSVSVSWPRAMPTIAITRHRGPGEDPEDLGHAVELALQRRLRALRRGDHVGDAAHLRRLARRDDHERRRAAGHLGVLEHQVRAVAERRLPLGKRRRVLGDRRALAGERRLLHLERRRRDDATVGGHQVARLEQHDVARHEAASSRPPRPPRSAARGLGTCSCASASTLARAFSSWLVPMTTLNVDQRRDDDAGRRSARWRSWPPRRSPA